MTAATAPRRGRAATLVLAAAIACASAGAGPGAQAAGAGDVLAKFLATVSVRHGVSHGSLVVLPIVLDAEPPPPPPAGKKAEDLAPAVAEAGAGVDWKPFPGSEALVELASGPAPEGRISLAPAGTLLLGGERERMLLRPVPLRGDEKATAAAIVCDSRRKPAAPAADTAPGPIVPLEQRRLALQGEGETVLTFVQQIQACLASLPVGTPTVAEVLASAFVTDGVRERMTELSRLPKASGGLAVGHVAFFGFRPVEVVMYARPADYQALGTAHLRSIAASHTFWMQTAGASALPATPEEVRRLVPEGLAILQSFARLPAPAVRARDGERTRWTLYSSSAERAARAGGRKEPFTVRFALDEGGRFACLEALDAGEEPIYPPPYTEPGGRPTGEPPGKREGALTEEFLRRALERIMEQKAKRDAQRERGGR